MYHTGGTTYSPCHDGLICILLSFYFYILINRDGAQPVVRVIYRNLSSISHLTSYIGLLMNSNALYIC